MSRLLVLLMIIGSAVPSTPPFEQFLKLYDNLLLDLQKCLQGMSLESLNKHPCLADGDVAKRQCRDSDGDELGECMGERASASRKIKKQKKGRTDSDLVLQALRTLRADAEECSAKPGALAFDWTAGVDTFEEEAAAAATALQRCGFIMLRKVVPQELVKSAEAEIREFLADKKLFQKFYSSEGWTSGTSADLVHGRPVNLGGSRYEVVPPAKGALLKIVEWYSERSGLPQLLQKVWKSSTPQLSYVSLLAQNNCTSAAQTIHFDASSSEDIKMQLAVHDYDPQDGPPQFFPTTHRLNLEVHSTLMNALNQFASSGQTGATGVQFNGAKAGDMILYFSNTLHAGTKRLSSHPRIVLDSMVHSTGRYYVGSERDTVDDSIGTASSTKARNAYSKVWHRFAKVRSKWRTRDVAEI